MITDTVFSAFAEEVRQYGLPNRVRGGRGGENIRVAAFILEHPMRGAERGSFIVGKSTHNQRIERLWRDVFTQCTVLFYQLFEDMQLLCADNDVHIFCLHYVYIPRLSIALTHFTNAWNNHPLSSEGNLTPIQLWIIGLARNCSHLLQEMTGVRVYTVHTLS